MTLLFAFFLLSLHLGVEKVVGSSCSRWAIQVPAVTNFTLRSCDGKYGPYSGHIPGSVHTDLMKAGVISGDPYYRYQEIDLSWIPQTCWVYESEPFALPASGLTESCNVRIRLRHVDSVATVALNGVAIGQADNAHASHDFLVPANALSTASNVLSLTFPPTLSYVLQASEAYPYSVPHTINYNVWAEPSHRNFIRKAGSDFGWDWGPAFINLGVGEGLSDGSQGGSMNQDLITLYQEPQFTLDGIAVTYEFLTSDLHTVSINVSAIVTYLDQSTHKSLVPRLFELYIDNQLKGTYKVPMACSEVGGLCNVAVATGLVVEGLELWYPRTLVPPTTTTTASSSMVSPKLYTVELRCVGEAPQSVVKRVGFRKVVLVQTPLSSTQVEALSHLAAPAPASFYISVNNLPVYVRGANYIPPDSLIMRVTEKDYK